jgi:hypothetical protein
VLVAFGAALALAYAAVPCLPVAVAAVAAALHVPTAIVSRVTRTPVLAAVVQLPLSIGMFTVLRRLATGHFAAVPSTTKLAAALRAGHALHAGGVDLTLTGFAALAASPMSASAIVVLVLAAVLVGSAVAARTGEQRPPLLLTLLPATSALFLPIAVTVFVAASGIVRAASGRLLL